MHRCPVCDEELYESREEKIVEEYQGQNYHFCSKEHRAEFEQSPGQYA